MYLLSIEKVKENVYAITDGSTRGNVAAYVLPTQIIFVDSGMNIPLIKKFREHIEQETDKKASVLFITHEHGDHVFGNQIFEDCEIITSKYTHEETLLAQEKNWTPEALDEWRKNAEDPSTLEVYWQNGRTRMQVALDCSSYSQETFINQNIEAGSTVATDKWSSYQPIVNIRCRNTSHLA